MEKTIYRSKNGEWCALQLRLADGRLAICGMEGRIVRRALAKKEAIDNWIAYFEDDAQAMRDFKERHGKRTPRSAALEVVAVDGEFHGLDVAREDGNDIYILSSCGQIREMLSDWFPEVRPYLKWHLNDMHAECEHQEMRGETYATHPDARCPDCGYRLGSAWTKRELPASVIAWAEQFNG